MMTFMAIPAIPPNYQRLRSLTTEEIKEARSFAYVAETSDPSVPVRRKGIDTSIVPFTEDDISDWRTRIYIVWFCYLFENFGIIEDPRTALYELILEFKNPNILDLPDRDLALGYSGVGTTPLSENARKRDAKILLPHYEKAIRLLEQFNQEKSVT